MVSAWFQAAWKYLSTSVVYRLSSIILCALISAELWPHPTHTAAGKQSIKTSNVFNNNDSFRQTFSLSSPTSQTFSPIYVNFLSIWTKGNLPNGPLRVWLWRINNLTEQKKVIKVIKCALHLQMKLWVLKMPSPRYLRRTRELLQRSLRNKRYKTTASH